MLGGADNANGELLSYITGANNESTPGKMRKCCDGLFRG